MAQQPFSIQCGTPNPIHPACPAGFSAYPDVDGSGVAITYSTTQTISPCAAPIITNVPPPSLQNGIAWVTPGVSPPALVTDAAHPTAAAAAWKPLPPHCWGWEGADDFLKTTTYNFAGTLATVAAGSGEYPFIQSITITRDYDVRVQRRMTLREITYSIDFFGVTAFVSDTCTDLSSSDVTVHHTDVFPITLGTGGWGSYDLGASSSGFWPPHDSDWQDSIYYDGSVTGSIGPIGGCWGRYIPFSSPGIVGTDYYFGRETRTTFNVVFTIHVTWTQYHCAPDGTGGGGSPPPCDCNTDCAPCGSNPPVKTGGCALLCADGGASVTQVNGWSIRGPDRVVAGSDTTPNGWSVSRPSACTLLVCAPCYSSGMSLGPYTVVWGTADTCVCPGHPPDFKIFGASFSLQVDVNCGGSSADGRPWNLQDSRGFYHAAGNKGAGVSYWRSDSAVPKPGWAVSAVPIATPATEPRIYNDYRGITFAVYVKPVGPSVGGGSFVPLRRGILSGFATMPAPAAAGVYRAWSLDDGATWRDEALAIPGGTHPTGNCDTGGTEIIAAYVGPIGGPGVIKATRQDSGDAAMSDPFTFLDSAGNAISVADDTFHVYPGHEGPGRWLMHVLVSGDGATSHWWSTDQCKTWMKIS